jgi:pSer/pThr/pTyr-binding forkhead associated (FHA) protein
VTFHGQERKSVGRTKENDIAIDDSSVSKLHASLMVDPNDCLIVADTGSTNGTFVNGRRIAYGKAVVLTTADKVKFGSVEVTFEPVDSGHPESIAPPTVAMVNNEVPGIPPEPEQPLPTVDQIDLDLGSGTGTKKS